MFLAKLKPQEVREPDGTVRYMVDSNAAKQLGNYVNPPFETYPTEEATATAAKQHARGAPQQKSAPATYMTAAGEFEGGSASSAPRIDPSPGRDVLRPVRVSRTLVRQ